MCLAEIGYRINFFRKKVKETTSILDREYYKGKLEAYEEIKELLK